MALPTASTPGYDYFTDKNTGKRYVACYHVIRFLTAAEKLGLARGLIKVGLDIVQLTGGAEASANTHALGAAFDVKQISDAWVRIFRQMGSAYWPRTGDAWVGNIHGHGVLDCAHDANCAYQYTAYWRGYSGLGQAKTGPYAGMWGYGSKDPDPWRPSIRRTVDEGIAWALAEAKKYAPAPEPAPTGEDYLMAEISESRLKEIIQGELRDPDYLREVGRFVLTGYPIDHDDNPDTPPGVLAWVEKQLYAAASEGMSDADVDRVATALAAKLPKATGA